MPMVREEREAEADELSQSPSLKWPRMSARCRWIKKPSAVAEQRRGIGRVTLKAVIEVMEEEFGATAAGARGDAEDGLEDRLVKSRIAMSFSYL